MNIDKIKVSVEGVLKPHHNRNRTRITYNIGSLGTFIIAKALGGWRIIINGNPRLWVPTKRKAKRWVKYYVTGKMYDIMERELINN